MEGNSDVSSASTLEAQPIGETCGEVSARQPLDRLKAECHTFLLSV